MEKINLLVRLESQCRRVKTSSGRYTDEAKRIVCKIVQSGEMTWMDVVRELGMPRDSARHWPLQLKRKKLSGGKRKCLSDHEKIKLVRQMEDRNLSARQAEREFNITASSLIKWKKKYSLQFYPQPRLTIAMTGPENENADSEQQERIRQLEKALSDEKLKVEALQAMIKIAEQEFNIPIRKKFGTKQSES